MRKALIENVRNGIVTPGKETIVRLPELPTENQIEAAIPYLDMNPARARRALRDIYRAFVDMRPEAQRPRDLTKKMAQLMELIQEYEEGNGMAPSQKELAEMIGADRAAVRKRLHALKRRGYIQLIEGRWRGIKIIKRV